MNDLKRISDHVVLFAKRAKRGKNCIVHVLSQDNLIKRVFRPNILIFCLHFGFHNMAIFGLGIGIRLKVILVVFLLADEVLHFLMVACFVKKDKKLLIQADCVWLLSVYLVHVYVKSGQS